MGPFLQWDQVEEKTIFAGYHARFIHSANMTFALWNVDANAPFPEHQHPNEQVTHLLDGQFELVIEGVSRIMKSGDMAIIPPYAFHSGKAITPCRILDTLSPRREDSMMQATSPHSD